MFVLFLFFALFGKIQCKFYYNNSHKHAPSITCIYLFIFHNKTEGRENSAIKLGFFQNLSKSVLSEFLRVS